MFLHFTKKICTMSSKTKVRRGPKRGKGTRRPVKSQVIGRRQGASRSRTFSEGSTVPNVTTGSPRYEFPTAQIFNVASQVQTVQYTMNDLFHAVVSGGAVSVPYVENYAANYTRYLVHKVTFSGKFINNDTTANTGGFLIIYPNDSAGTLPSNATQWSQARAGKYTRFVEFSIPSANTASFSLRARFDMAKIYGREYMTNESYAAVLQNSQSIVGSSPTTVISMVLAVSTFANFTVTSGGLFSDVRVTKTVRLYGPDSNDLITFVSDGTKLLGIEQPDPLSCVVNSHRICSSYTIPSRVVTSPILVVHVPVSYSTRVYLIELEAIHLSDVLGVSLADARSKLVAVLDGRILSPGVIYVLGSLFSPTPDILLELPKAFCDAPVSSQSPVLVPKFCSNCGASVLGCKC